MKLAATVAWLSSECEPPSRVSAPRCRSAAAHGCVQPRRLMIASPTAAAHAGEPMKSRGPNSLSAQPDTEALGQHGSRQSHEAHSHGQSVPEESRIVRGEMVVAGPETGECDSGKEGGVGPSLPSVGKRRPITRAGGERRSETQQAHGGEGRVREHVEEIGNSQPGPTIGKEVVCERLRYRRRQGGGQHGADCRNAKKNMPHDQRTARQTGRAFALINMALSDALVTVMETKYYYAFWRPETAIRAGDADGSPRTEADIDFVPFLSSLPGPLGITPCFPSYPSAHATASYAARRVVQEIWGAEGHSIDVIALIPPSEMLTLYYTSLRQITEDIDDARVYGGIHFRFDQDAGARQGWRIGGYVHGNILRPVQF